MLRGACGAPPSPHRAFIRNDTAITESPCAQVPNETLNRAAIRVCTEKIDAEQCREGLAECSVDLWPY